MIYSDADIDVDSGSGDDDYDNSDDDCSGNKDGNNDSLTTLSMTQNTFSLTQ